MDSDRGKLFIGGIPWETNEEKLKNYFNAFGEVVETVIMKDRMTGRARGFGFVAFADPAVADRVLLEKHTIDGRLIEAKKAIPREEQHNFARTNNPAPVAPGGIPRTKKIFVGGLASTVTDEEFKNYFSQFGNITDVVVMYDHNTQRPRGFGFITFDSEDAVEKVVQQAFHQLQGKTVEVKKAVPRELSVPGGGRTSSAGFGSGSGAGRGMPYNAAQGPGYVPTAPGNAYGAPRHPMPAGRGGFPPYGVAPYAAPGYGGNSGYGMAMNGGYGAPYPAAGAYTGGYGGASPAAPYATGPTYGTAGAPAAGYVNAPVAPRSPWGNSSNSFTGGVSPAGYAAGGAVGMTGYAAPAWPSAPVTGQAAGPPASYGNGSYGYGTGEAGYGSHTGGYQARPPPAADGPSAYNDAYAAAAAYGESTWKADGTQAMTSGPGAAGGYNPVAGGSGITGGIGIGSSMEASAGFSMTNWQTQQDSDARFRTYSAIGEHAV